MGGKRYDFTPQKIHYGSILYPFQPEIYG